MKLLLIVIIALIIPFVIANAQPAQEYKKRFALAESLIMTETDSAISLFKELLVEFPTTPQLYWVIGLSYSYKFENNRACLNYYIVKSLGYDLAGKELEMSNCLSCVNEWLPLIKEYDEFPDEPGYTSIGLSKNKYKKKGDRMVEIGKSYQLKEDGRTSSVVLTKASFYTFGKGLHFIDEFKNVNFKIDSYSKKNGWTLRSSDD
jgi:hypothetical protein